MNPTATLTLILLFAGADPVPKRTDLDEAVDRALAYLQRHQEPDGSWVAGHGKSPAVTSLAVMAFLSAGHVPGEGPYGPTIEKGIRWILKQQQDEKKFDGLIASDPGHEMYHHGISTLMLAEVAGMTQGSLADEIRKKLPKAVAVILKAQRGERAGVHRGGWRYHVDAQLDENQSDLSVTGWQLLALRAAKNLGCDVPPASIDEAVEFIRRCQVVGRDPRRDADAHAFNYYPGYRPTPACTATAILCLELCRKERGHAPEALEAVAYLRQNPPRWGQTGETHFFYTLYYCSQALFQLGDNYWNEFRPQLHQVLLENQKSDSGGWFGEDQVSRIYGPNYGTAMAVLALTVEYRYLPIYQRGEEPKAKK